MLSRSVNVTSAGQLTPQRQHGLNDITVLLVTTRIRYHTPVLDWRIALDHGDRIFLRWMDSETDPFFTFTLKRFQIKCVQCRSTRPGINFNLDVFDTKFRQRQPLPPAQDRVIALLLFIA